MTTWATSPSGRMTAGRYSRAEYEQIAFLAGFQLGAQLILELTEDE